MSTIDLPSVVLPPSALELQAEVRSFLREETAEGHFVPRCDAWVGGFNPAFSRKLGERGWLGMTWPRRYGGKERSMLDRFVLTEELLACGAPVAAHWMSDRQIGPSLLRYGSEAQRERFLPGIARGELYFSVGMSEPDIGSDLASVRTRAERVNGGWVLNGTKVWTTHGHRAHFIMTLCRTSQDAERHAGLSQLIVDLSAKGVTARPIALLTGEHEFAEVVFEDVFVSDEMVFGEIGGGWHQITADLAYERGGPERILSTYPLLVTLMRFVGEDSGEHVVEKVGALVAQLSALRRMSLGVAALFELGQIPAIEAALVKDAGTQFESKVIDAAREIAGVEPALDAETLLGRLLAEAVLHAPGFTLRGGTSEILRGIVARNLGLR